MYRQQKSLYHPIYFSLSTTEWNAGERNRREGMTWREGKEGVWVEVYGGKGMNARELKVENKKY